MAGSVVPAPASASPSGFRIRRRDERWRARRATWLVLVVGALLPVLCGARDAGGGAGARHPEAVRLIEQADARAQRGDYAPALDTYLEALDLVPAPYTALPECTRLLGSIGETLFRLGHHEQARAALSDTMHCPGAIGTPGLHLRLGQALFELGNLERANDELARAYLAGGREIFEGEDAKYFEHLKTVLRPPASGEW